MWGLIFKDMLFIKSTWKNLIVMFIGSLMMSIAFGNYLLTVVILPLMFLTSGIQTFQTDEFYNTESYTLAYPLTRKQIVQAKYLFTLIMLIIASFTGLLIYSLIHFTINPGYDGLNTNMIKYLLMLEASSLLVNAIFYPVIYKFGCEKSRFVLLSVVMLLTGLLSLLSVYINVFDGDAIDMKKVITFIENNGLLVLSILVTTVTIISYKLSIIFYKKQDY